jgi:hypothetical protein
MMSDSGLAIGYITLPPRNPQLLSLPDETALFYFSKFLSFDTRCPMKKHARIVNNEVTIMESKVEG